ncbi:oligosaccharide flippase family protein [archaeon]|nr:oligosaccharide flippase family protein [archaeon]
MNHIIEEEAGDIKNIFSRFKKRDFSGPTGQVVKNSTYKLITNLIAKFGSLIFMIIIARMLAPEFFGLYTLTLSTILLFSTFSDLGISTTMLIFVSKTLGKNNPEKAKTYFKGLLKYKIYLLIISSGTLMLSAYLISNYWYNKPIFYALLAGGLYIPMSILAEYINTAFQAGNNFKAGMAKEIIFQISRFILIPLGLLYFLKINLGGSMIITGIILILVFCHFISFLYLRIISKKQILYLRKKASGLKKQEKQELKKFILPLSFTLLSGTFFGYIDTLMLGHYISDATYIGYYGAAFGLIGSAGLIIGFIAASVLPVFSRLQGKLLEKIFEKTKNFTLSIGAATMIFTYFMAEYILMIYGGRFLPATIILKLFSILLITLPLSGIYISYFVSLKKTRLIAKLLITSTIVNIILNIWFISYGLQFGMMEGVIGACIATICSRIFYLGGLILSKRKI